MMMLLQPARSPALRLCLMMALCAASAIGALAQESKLGKVDFPTSGSAEAQAHFLRGVAALHSFWYDEALDEFQAATKLDPDFMMGYWGEAMTYNHPLWAQQDTEAGRRAIAKIRDIPKLAAKERGFIDAIRKLYGEGDKLARDEAYSTAMEKLYRAYPDDLEPASFYALSLLGTVRPGDQGFRRQLLAGAIALEVYRKNPNHPGAAHYIIHAFDNPEHAILALDAARRYSEIAPAAFHARHMPSHIFLQLGMWPEAAASNESSWAVSDEWVKRKRLPIAKRDYHSLHWLLYIYLQQGRQSKAEELLSLLRQSIQQAGDESKMGRPYSADMAAAFIVETERWELASQLFGATDRTPDAKVSARKATAQSAADMPMSHCSAPLATADKAVFSYVSSRNALLATFIEGLAAAENGSSGAEKRVAELGAIRRQLTEAHDLYRAKQVEIMETEVAATDRAHQGNYEEAVSLMKRATALEEELSPPSGPPDLIKPTHELFGEILLRAGRPQEAAQEFKISLLREPNRARSLLGVARAATKSGNASEAATAYTSFLGVWGRADPQLAELREARAWLAQAGARP